MISRSADGKVTKSKLYQTPDKQRFDPTIEIRPGTSIETHMIIGRHEKLIYLVEPQQKTILVNHALQRVNASGGGSSSSNPSEELILDMVVAKQAVPLQASRHGTANGRSLEKRKQRT